MGLLSQEVAREACCTALPPAHLSFRLGKTCSSGDTAATGQGHGQPTTTSFTIALPMELLCLNAGTTEVGHEVWVKGTQRCPWTLCVPTQPKLRVWPGWDYMVSGGSQGKGPLSSHQLSLTVIGLGAPQNGLSLEPRICCLGKPLSPSG